MNQGEPIHAPRVRFTKLTKHTKPTKKTFPTWSSL